MTNRLAADETQAVVWRWEGEAFGNTAVEELFGAQVNLRFPGQYFDRETNLSYNWHRYHDLELGRHITSDPIGLQGGMNTYGYAYQNPVVHYDPFSFGARFSVGGQAGPVKVSANYDLGSYHGGTDSTGSTVKQSVSLGARYVKISIGASYRKECTSIEIDYICP